MCDPEGVPLDAAGPARALGWFFAAVAAVVAMFGVAAFVSAWWWALCAGVLAVAAATVFLERRCTVVYCEPPPGPPLFAPVCEQDGGAPQLEAPRLPLAIEAAPGYVVMPSCPVCQDGAGALCGRCLAAVRAWAETEIPEAVWDGGAAVAALPRPRTGRREAGE
jgi:hypothetical protein